MLPVLFVALLGLVELLCTRTSRGRAISRAFADRLDLLPEDGEL